MIFDGNKVIAIIPARGGSKGIPRKNLTKIAGKPLITYTIKAAQNSIFVDSVWVSSDDDEILNISETLGAKPLARPSELANDQASAVVVVNHFIRSLPDELRKDSNVIVYLQPTSPLRHEKHIDLALKQMEQANADSLVSVVAAETPPQKSFLINEEGRLMSLFDERQSNARRQDLPRCYYPNGAIYAFRISEFLARNGFPSNGSVPFVMSSIDSIDIDDPSDLIRAEVAIGERNARN